MSAALCTICIPAFQAAAFIARTLDCAQAQTERAIAIHVSIDQCDDDTVAICEARAALDPRIKVTSHATRQGWGENTNFLIRSVETPFYFLYFHDDLIADSYVARLCGMLQKRPDAATAHADMKHFGATDHVAPGAAYEGSAFERQFQFLEGKSQPPLLRSVTRTASACRANALIPDVRARAMGAHHVYVLNLLAAGPALYLPEVLYQRHNMREGGLTESWRHATLPEVRTAFEDNADAIMSLNADVHSRELQRLVAFLFVMTRMRLAEHERKTVEAIPAAEVSKHFREFSPLLALEGASVAIQEYALRAYARILYLEGIQCERRRDFGGALGKMAASAIADAGEGRAARRLEHLRRKSGRSLRMFEAETETLSLRSAPERVQTLLLDALVG